MTSKMKEKKSKKGKADQLSDSNGDMFEINSN